MPNIHTNVHIFTADITSVLDQLDSCVDEGIHLVCNMEEALFSLFETPDEEYPPALQLECKLFETAAIPNLLQGFVYMLPLYHSGNLFIRYIASGSYKSAVPKLIEQIKKITGVRDDKIYLWELYTAKDFQLQSKTSAKGNAETLYNRKIGCSDSTKMNKKSALGLINIMKTQLERTHTIVFVHKSKAHPDKPTHRYVSVSTSHSTLKGRHQSPSGGLVPSLFFLNSKIFCVRSYTEQCTGLPRSLARSCHGVPRSCHGASQTRSRGVHGVHTEFFTELIRS